jgi:hypothetical protein
MWKLPESAGDALARVRILSCDAAVLFGTYHLFGEAACRLEHLFIRRAARAHSTQLAHGTLARLLLR